MKNQTLQALAVIKKRLDNCGRDCTFTEVLENNKTEIDFLANKFKLKEEEALFLIASCIYSIEDNSEFDVNDLARMLEVSRIEILLYQKHLNALVEKELLVAYPKDCGKHYRNNTKSSIEILNKDFMLHSSVGEHLS
ncbi:MAG: hypothetical protein WCY89_09935 [Flavobacteriaceae bacterium]